jgi:hypothetical protein
VDPGADSVIVNPIGSHDLLLLKYDTNGEFQWVDQFGSSSGSMGARSMAVAGSGNIYVIGGLSGTWDLDPGAGVYLASNPDTSAAGYLVQLDAAGEFVSAYVTEGTGSGGFRDIALAADGSVLIGGAFRGTTDFAPGPAVQTLTSIGNYINGFALKLASDLSLEWARQFGDGGEVSTQQIEVDSEGNAYLGGSFGRLVSPGATFDFDPGAGFYPLAMPSTHETGFVLSLSNVGDFRWAIPLGGNAGRAAVQGLAVTNDDVVHLSGDFQGTGDFNPNPADQYLLNSGTVQSVFVANLAQSNPDPGAPVVDAGPPQTILVTGMASLDGTVTDDGLPNPVSTTWSLASGPGAVNFANASAIDTTATFSTIGTYNLKLEATDGQFTTADFVQVQVNPLTATLTATGDTYIAEAGKATTNFGTAASLTVDGKPDHGALLKWDLSSIPAGSTIQSVALSINVTGTSTDTYEIYEVKRSWTESQATWKKANSSTNWQSAGAQGALDRGSTVLGTVSATATGIRTVILNAAGLAVVQGWVNNPFTNFGFVFQDYANSTDDDLVFSSREISVAANRPQLIVLYNPPSVAPLSFGTMAASTSTSGDGGFVPPVLDQSSAATKSTSNLLLAVQPARRLRTAAVDSALAQQDEGDVDGWDNSLDDQLLLALVS